MNINYLKKNHDLITYLKKRNFTQLVEKPTHKLGGLLDHIYVSQSLLEQKPFYSQRSVYFSDHDNITLHIPKKYSHDYCEDIDMAENRVLNKNEHEHSSTDDDGELFQCKFCDQDFHTIKDRLAHENKYHPTIHLNEKTVLEEQK